jgi:hypothetical protein
MGTRRLGVLIKMERRFLSTYLLCEYNIALKSRFARWLGQNSKQSKLQRQLGDVQARMRMKVSGDKTEIRRYYLPALFPHIVEPFADKGRDKAVGASVALTRECLNPPTGGHQRSH